MNEANKPIHVFSEIGDLKTVLLKRPGREVENLTPDIMDRLLLDDIPHLPVIQKEHDQFADVLRENGVEVLYLEKLSAEAIDASGNKEAFVEAMLDESHVQSESVYAALKEYLLSMNTYDMVESMMAGVRKKEIEVESKRLADISDRKHYPFYMDPMPNLYFTRDPGASIGNGMTINNMTFEARKRETLFLETIMKHHPRFKDSAVEIYRDRNETTSMEGGDELVLNDKVLAVGISQRTEARAIEDLAHELFKKHTTFEKVLAIKIPNVRAMMHLDTVFTMIDHNKFTIHPGILELDGSIDTYTLEKSLDSDELKITHQTDLEKVLKEALGVEEIELIQCGGGDAIAAPREQWNDGSNTLAIAPGVVVTYDRNHVSNGLMREKGIKVIEIESSELSRGRGGPRCMSMPLVRKDIEDN
ncbi:arginine deiminase [Alkalibacterium kapii]|uniref:Arginine deiminase n=1 Tax=Alkalibacterium kapii TaxID=426704 RepID=A0A511ASI5_9LACT|nr:arginine deiminase [Alkalibacterium kapii]GEK91164.1 arginine deiminase [Alkalibacterium kapii]